MSKYDYDAVLKSNIEFLRCKRLNFRKIKSKNDIRNSDKRLVGMLSLPRVVKNKSIE